MDFDAKRLLEGPWDVVGIHEQARSRGGRRRKMKFHMWQIGRDEESVGDGGRG